MQVKLVKNDNLTYDIKLIDGSKKLTIMYGGNGDLYWSLVNDDWEGFYEGITDYFDITKENYEVYKSFEVLLLDIQTINISGEITTFPGGVETEEEQREYLLKLEAEKENYRKHNMANYNNLYSAKNNEVTWISDELAEEVANEVTISKHDEIIRLSFKTKPQVAGYDKNYFDFGMISIRFRNSGSRYRPFNLIFMRMFNELQNLTVNDLGPIKQLTHQK